MERVITPDGREHRPSDIDHRGAPGTPGGFDFPAPGGGSYPGPDPGPAPGPGGGFGAALRSIQSPYWIMPPQATPFTVEANAVGFAVGNTPQVIAGSPFPIPPDNVAVIRSLTLNVNVLLTTSLLTWILRLNNTPANGWNNLQVFPRNAGSVAQTWGGNECFIIIPEGAAIDAQINVRIGDANTYQAGIAYAGWFFDKQIAHAFEEAYKF